MSSRLRNFLLISILGMLCVLAAVVIIYGEVSTESLRNQHKGQNEILVRVVANALGYHGLNDLLTPPGDMDESELSNRPILKPFSDLVDRHMQGLPIVKVKLYNRDGITVYSTDSSEIGNNNIDSENLQQALGGVFASKFIQWDAKRVSGAGDKVDILESYLPISAEGPAIQGVLELYSNITEAVVDMQAEQRRMVLYVTFIFLLYYAIQFVIFYRTDQALKIEERERDSYMNQLVEANDELETRVAERTEALEAERFRLQTIIDGIADPLMVIGMDLRVTSMNSAARDLIPKKAKPGDYSHCYQITHRQSEPCSGPDHICTFKEVISANKACSLLHIHYNAKGEKRFVEVTSTPMRDHNGEMLGIIEVEHDVTEVVSARNRLEESQERTQAVMDTVNNAILTMNEEGIIEDINESGVQMLGYLRDHLLGNSVSLLLDDSFIEDISPEEGLNGMLRHLLTQGVCETTAIDASGRHFPVEFWVGEVKIQEQTKYIGAFEDISARKQAENELEETRQHYFHQEKMAAIGQLAAGILHEVGNPIAAISGSIQAIHAAHDEVSSFTDSSQALNENNYYLDMIEQQVNRLSTITREIADFASPRPLECELLDLNSLIQSTAILMRYDKRLKQVDLQLDLDKNLPAVNGVADQLTQVFMNLIINAVDACAAMDRQSVIHIRSTLEMNYVHILVEDNGSGMDTETLDRAMDAFFTTKSAGKGTGLGLSLCNSIISKHDGRMQIASVPEEGAQVHVYLPLDGDPL